MLIKYIFGHLKYSFQLGLILIVGFVDGTEKHLMRHQRTQEVYQRRPEIDKRRGIEGTKRNVFTPALKKNLTNKLKTKIGKEEV